MVRQSSNRLRALVNAVKDKVSMGKATLLPSTSAAAAAASPLSPDLAVLRATTHHASPCHPCHIAALLAFGRASRLAASAAVAALASRLCSTRDPVVAIKCLLAVHYVVRHGAFILHDQILPALRPSRLGGRNPLNLSGFRASAYVRWYARLLEVVLASHAILGSFPQVAVDREKLVSLRNGELLAQLDVLLEIMEEAERQPGGDKGEQTRLAAEVGRMVEEERVAVVEEVRWRVMEVAERVGDMGFGELVEVGFSTRRVEGCRFFDGEQSLRVAAEDLKEKVEKRVKVIEGKELRRGEKRLSESQRHPTGKHDEVIFGSSRWVVG